MDVKLTINGHQIRVSDGPYTDGEAATDAANTFATELIEMLPEMKAFAAQQLRQIYNESWVDDEHGELTETQFIANLTSPDIEIYDEIGAAVVYFEDSDMFGGHSIDVSIEDGKISHASIVG